MRTAPIVRLKDVARVELGARLFETQGRYDGKPAAVIGLTKRRAAMRLPVRPRCARSWRRPRRSSRRG